MALEKKKRGRPSKKEIKKENISTELNETSVEDSKNETKHNTQKHNEIKKEIETQVDSSEKIEELKNESLVIKNVVVKELKEDMDLAIKKHFEAMRNILLGEIREVSDRVAQNQPILEQPHISPDVAVPPNQKPIMEGLKNNETRHPQQGNEKKGGFDIGAMLQNPELMKAALEMIKPKEEPQVDPIMGMMQQVMMKKFFNDLTKQDSSTTAINNFLIKKLMKADPDLFKDDFSQLG